MMPTAPKVSCRRCMRHYLTLACALLSECPKATSRTISALIPPSYSRPGRMRTPEATAFPVDIRFHWTASHEAQSGLASSYERSAFSLPNDDLSIRDVTEKYRNLLSSYPVWLCGSRTASLGLLCAVPHDGGAVSVCFAPTLTPILKFGAPSFHVRSETRDIPSVVCEFPIRGGLLAWGSGHGKLQFEIESVADDKQLLETRIVGYVPSIIGPHPSFGGFRPASMLVLFLYRFRPASTLVLFLYHLRRRLYLCSQRLYHAHVMACFHRHCHATLLRP